MLEFGEVDVVLAFVGKGGNKVNLDHVDSKGNKVFGLDVEDNNNKYLQVDLKLFIQDYKGKLQRNKACRWILGRCGTGHKKSWKRQRSG
jgi:hypothetical protein